MSNFSKRLTDLMKENDCTQQQLADLLLVKRQTIGKYTKEISEPNIDSLKKLADYFNVSVDYLLGREDDFGNISISPTPTFELTENEKKHITNLRKLPTETQSYIFGLVANLAVSS